ncbi:hypothetical protein RUM43_008274 [Polyplax serrata]|uniref:Uncharacterized protein n=1 Tax=Polyplax serrata TaxID=468196 RepID=A0AAN8PYR7_POLSC
MTRRDRKLRFVSLVGSKGKYEKDGKSEIKVSNNTVPFVEWMQGSSRKVTKEKSEKSDNERQKRQKVDKLDKKIKKTKKKRKDEKAPKMKNKKKFLHFQSNLREHSQLNPWNKSDVPWIVPVDGGADGPVYS